MTPYENQEFFRMARRLSEPGAYLAKMDNGFGLMVKKNKWQKPVMRVDEKMVSLFAREALLQKAKKSDTYALSDTGQAKNNRHQAGHMGYVAQHKDVQPTRAGGAINLSAHPLKFLCGTNKNSHVHFTESEFKSAERINRDYEISLYQTGLSVDWSRPISSRQSFGSSAKTDLPNRVMDAHKRLQRAFDYVGPDLSDILKLVCCQHYGLEAAEKKLNWPRRSAKLVLKFSLSRLANHYGY